MRFAKRLLVSLSSLDMFGQEARFRPINIRSIEDHAVVRIGIRGRIVTIEVHRASIVTVVGIAKTISTAKTASRTSALFAGAKVLQKNESESQRAICFVKQFKKREGRCAPLCSLCSASTMLPTLASCSSPPSIHRGLRRSPQRHSWAQRYHRSTPSQHGHRSRQGQNEKHREDRS